MTSVDSETKPRFELGSFLERSRARFNLDVVPESHDVSIDAPRGDHVLNPGQGPSRETIAKGLRPAAVLIPVIGGDNDPRVIMTERTEHLPAHAGQVSFPGGKIEDHDDTPLATALRETEEEIGLKPDFVDPIGYLPPYQTTTGYRITPVIATVRPGFTIVPDPSEVERVFEVPLEFLMNPSNHKKESRFWNNAERYFFVMPYGDHYIWGITAGIIRALYEEVFET